VGQKAEQNSLCARRIRSALLRRVNASARTHTIDNHSPQKLELNLP
jgi:hypothetical protein